jgi:hypothetical protein
MIAKDIFEEYGCNINTIPMEEDGLDLFMLEEKIKTKESEIDRATELAISSDLSPAAKSRITQKLNLLEIELSELNNLLNQAKQAISEETFKNQFSEAEFKSFIEQLDAHKDDFIFRSSVNNLLIKLIERLELIDGEQEFMPWEYDDGNEIIEAYRSVFKGRKKMALSQILKNSDFETFSRNYKREIKICYRTGVVRQLMVGKNASLPVKQ